MASLYEINQAILDCIDMETGELIDPERLEQLTIEKDQKIENVACWIKNLTAEAAAYKAEKAAFAEREAQALKKADTLKKWLSDALAGQKFSTAKCAVSFRKSEAVMVDDVNLIPAEMLRIKTTYEPDKTAIKNAIKSGREINGCMLVENTNIQIK